MSSNDDEPKKKTAKERFLEWLTDLAGNVLAAVISGLILEMISRLL